MARHACGVVDAEADTTLHALHQLRVAVGVEEIRERDHGTGLLKDAVQGPHVLLMVEGCEHFPVVPSVIKWRIMRPSKPDPRPGHGSSCQQRRRTVRIEG